MEKKFSSELTNCLFNNTTITAENVKDFGEFIAITAVKKALIYSGDYLFELYTGLVHDIFDYKDASENYSIGYDIAQTAICFLCEHLGKGLEEEFEIDKHGRSIVIRQACYKKVYKFIDQYRNHIHNTKSLEELSVNEEPSVEIFKEESKKEYVDCDVVIEKMELNDKLKETLNCYREGMKFVEIAKYLCVNLSTVWRRRIQLQKIYNKKIGIYGN